MERVLIAVRRRLRLQAALDGGTRVAVVAATVVLVAVYLWQLGILGTRGLLGVLGGAAGLTAAGALACALRRIPLERVAKRIDRSHGLHDRFGSALAFEVQPERTPFMEAAISDARAQAERVSPKRAAPVARPRGLGAVGLVSAAAVIVALLRFPAPGASTPPAAPRVPRLAVASDVLEPEREAVAELEREVAATGDEETAAQARELQELLEQLDAEALTRKQVFDKLAEIEKKLEGEAGDFEALKRALKKAGAELGQSKLTRELAEALKKEDLAEAKKELEKLAEEAARLDAERKEKEKDKKLDEKQREELARSLERAARPQEKSAEEKKREAEEKRLREEERRLRKELAERPNDRELQRRLKRNQRELERLEREKQRLAEQRRQLERLQRELQKAAEQLRQKLSPEAAEALRRAAQQMGQMEDELRKLGNAQRVQVQIAELKEMLRRAGQSGKGQNGQQARLGQGQKGQQGSNGQNQGKTLRLDFNQRAGGDQRTVVLGLPGGRSSVLLPLPGQGQAQPGQPGQNGQGQPNQPGEGIGDQHDPNVLGDPTKIDAKRQMSRIQGQEGEGPSKSETILGSAEKGFAGRGYRRVYSDYTAVVEEVMSKERVPPGYRYYVKRYFQLIRPRD